MEDLKVNPAHLEMNKTYFVKEKGKPNAEIYTYTGNNNIMSNCKFVYYFRGIKGKTYNKAFNDDATFYKYDGASGGRKTRKNRKRRITRKRTGLRR